MDASVWSHLPVDILDAVALRVNAKDVGRWMRTTHRIYNVLYRNFRKIDRLKDCYVTLYLTDHDHIAEGRKKIVEFGARNSEGPSKEHFLSVNSIEEFDFKDTMRKVLHRARFASITVHDLELSDVREIKEEILESESVSELCIGSLPEDATEGDVIALIEAFDSPRVKFDYGVLEHSVPLNPEGFFAHPTIINLESLDIGAYLPELPHTPFLLVSQARELTLTVTDLAEFDWTPVDDVVQALNRWREGRKERLQKITIYVPQIWSRDYHKRIRKALPWKRVPRNKKRAKGSSGMVTGFLRHAEDVALNYKFVLESVSQKTLTMEFTDAAPTTRHRIIFHAINLTIQQN